MSMTVRSSAPAHEDRDHRAARLLAEGCTERDPAQAARLREQVVLDNQGLAIGLAKRFEGRGIELDDLIQVAMLGLVQAARRYRPDRGSGFTAFAAPTITGELKRYFRDHGWAVRPPRGLQEMHHRVREATSALEQELQRMPTIEEIATEADVAPQEVRSARAAGDRYRARSLDEPLGDPAGPSLGESLSLEDTADAPDADPYDRAASLISLRSAMADLDERERQILGLRFTADLTQQEIGQRVGVSQMQVSRILSSICRRLRTRIEGRTPSSGRATTGARPTT